MGGYYAIKFISWLLCHAPLWVRNIVAACLGNLAVFFCPGWRLQMAVANIQECLGKSQEEAEVIARNSLRRFGRMAVEVLRFPLLNRDNIDEIVKIDGLEYLQQAVAEGRGAVLCTGHFGNWELMGAAVALHGYPLLSIVRHQNQGKMNSLINEYRVMVGQKIVYNRGENNLLQVVKALKRQNLIGVIFDQDTNDIGVTLPLFGKDCIVPDGVAALSRCNHSPIVPMFMHNNEDGTCTLKIYPIHYCHAKEEYGRVMGDLKNILEQEVMADPSMWFWVHDRWKDGRQRFDKNYKKKKHGHHHGK